MTEHERDWTQRIYWIENFLSDGFKQIAKQLGQPGTNAHFLSVKKFNLQTIEKFKTAALEKIAELESENNQLKKQLSDKQMFSIGDLLPKRQMNENQKEALRIDSISQAQQDFPNLF